MLVPFLVSISTVAPGGTVLMETRSLAEQTGATARMIDTNIVYCDLKTQNLMNGLHVVLHYADS